VGANSYTYDAAGNITADGVNTYTWSAAGLLGIVKVGGTTVGTYTYNAWNQRAKKVAASTAYYVYGAGGLLYGEYDTSGNFIREYVYLNSAPLAQINSGSPEVLTYLHTDHLGTPRFGTNTGGTQVWAWANDAFGTSTPTGTTTVNLRMAGQYFDSESGLFNNWNRYYNPAIGRYISSDPISIAGGLNTFGYVGQSPVMRIDPWAWKPGDPYSSPEEAAKAALQDIFELSRQQHVEYAGRIYQLSSGWPFSSPTYSYTAPNPGDEVQSDPGPTTCGGKGPNRGYYHTHVISNDFSDTDMGLATREQEPGYLATPTGDVYEYIPMKTNATEAAQAPILIGHVF
ncbi:MAG: DUF4329 domain-containing protein, partial [Acidobacteriia bacterium]|nr:DUF4329 domain-containing protein [Terriglobia bacterium]